ncbi:TspO protein [Desulfuribacillus stibiiarsenatis]|uniref:TspO protein n=1 Tax=Desulfuribacillus stibiiarsenatis TaxID=1390249 RepID=A0A1E5L5H6_9FIRM|nr:TspO/MBR family protein [Desulfuribacillus stibiiarsenatis]OEH85366.1 TspO protein [Desulfuribacillus stibiiarsenatis]
MFNFLRVNGKRSIFALIISIAIAQGIGLLSTLLTRNSFEIYQTLTKPWFAPPQWVFGPVWTILFVLMGLAAYRVWMSGYYHPFGFTDQMRRALTLYGIQFVFNFLWSILFFRFQWYGIALIDLLILLALIIITAREFYKIDRLAGLLMIPYIVWVSFAGILNYYIWILNR